MGVAEKKYKQTDIGLIPVDWEIKALNGLSHIIDSLHQTPNFCEDGFAMVRVTDIKAGNLNLDPAMRVSEGIFSIFTKNYKPKYGDIVMSRVGSYGVSSFVVTKEPFCMGQNTVVIEPKISNKFLYYILNSPHIKIQIEEESFGTGYKSLSLKNIKELKIPHPPTKAEQTAIATALSDADALILSIEKLIAKKRSIKTGTMQELLKPKKGWEVKKIADVAGLSSGGTPLTSNSKYYNGGIPWVVIADITKSGKYISDTEKSISIDGLNNSSAKLFYKGTILFAMYASIGKCAISTIDLTCNQAILGIQVNSINLEYLYYYLTFNELKFIRMGQTGTQSNLSKEIVGNIDIPYPPADVQAHIANILGDMDSEIATLEMKLDKAKQIKKGMMQQLLTGKIRLI